MPDQVRHDGLHAAYIMQPIVKSYNSATQKVDLLIVIKNIFSVTSVSSVVKLDFLRARQFFPFPNTHFICTVFVFANWLVRRGDREAEGARLEIVCAETYRGFESLLLRQFVFFPLPYCMEWEKVYNADIHIVRVTFSSVFLLQEFDSRVPRNRGS